MDKELIDRLADAAGAESLAIYGAPSQLTGEAIERFATMVAEECAKIAETAEGETVCLEAYSRQANIQRAASARAIRVAFKASEAPR